MNTSGFSIWPYKGRKYQITIKAYSETWKTLDISAVKNQYHKFFCIMQISMIKNQKTKVEISLAAKECFMDFRRCQISRPIAIGKTVNKILNYSMKLKKNKTKL